MRKKFFNVNYIHKLYAVMGGHKIFLAKGSLKYLEDLKKDILSDKDKVSYFHIEEIIIK